MKAYKQLRKKLKNKFVNPYNYIDGYEVMGAIESWVTQCGIKCTDKHVHVLTMMHGGVFYPYQKKDRKKVLKYLKKNKKGKTYGK